MRTIGTNNATNGHEKAVGPLRLESAVIKRGWGGLYPRYIPKSRTRSKHELAQGPHNTIRSSTVLKDRDGPFACEYASLT